MPQRKYEKWSRPQNHICGSVRTTETATVFATADLAGLFCKWEKAFVIERNLHRTSTSMDRMKAR